MFGANRGVLAYVLKREWALQRNKLCFVIPHPIKVSFQLEKFRLKVVELSIEMLLFVSVS